MNVLRGIWRTCVKKFTKILRFISNLSENMKVLSPPVTSFRHSSSISSSSWVLQLSVAARRSEKCFQHLFKRFKMLLSTEFQTAKEYCADLKSKQNCCHRSARKISAAFFWFFWASICGINTLRKCRRAFTTKQKSLQLSESAPFATWTSFFQAGWSKGPFHARN